MSQLKLKITLGNEAMQTGYDLSKALITVANKLQCIGNPKGESGSIMDVNGNTVGSWSVS